jgi:phage terminase large subunit
LPHEARLERRGLDFGYTNDPSAIVDVYKYNGAWILDEQLYQQGLSNRALADIIKNLAENQTLVIADSAEPKSIDEIRGYGVNIVAAEKGPDSVRSGIQFIQDQKISVTKRSINLLKEYRNYLWKTDRDGRTLNVPEEGQDHLMDALRYAFNGHVVQNNNDEAAIKYALQRRREYEQQL